MKKPLIVTFLFLCIISITASAQFGIKASVLSPGGDITPIYKNGKAFEFYLVQDLFKGRLQGRAGFFHTTLSPSLDTFHIYGVKSEIDGSHTLLPGFAVYHKLRMNCIYIDQSFRIVKVKGLALYAGIGLIFGWSRMEYDRTIETVIIESGIENPDIAGLKGNIRIAYKLGGHFQVYGEAMHNAIVATDWSRSFSHNAFGIGVNYYINSN